MGGRELYIILTVEISKLPYVALRTVHEGRNGSGGGELDESWGGKISM